MNAPMLSPGRRRILGAAAVASVALVLAGCTQGSDTLADAGEADGIVTIYGPIEGVEAERLDASWAEWEAENGIEIEYEGTKEFEAQVSVRVQGGSAPDLAIFPQPGLLADLARRGYVQEAPEGVVANAEQYWSADWRGYGTVDDVFYGAPLMASLKGFVWYSPAKFAEWGVEVPETWDELLSVSQTISEKTGGPSWCAGFGDGASTGWSGTDWVEDLVLRQSGTEVYDGWVSHEIPFSDPAIQSAFDAVGDILLDPELVNAGFGDVPTIASTPFGDVARTIGDGSCPLTHQASFFDGFIQDPENGNASVGPDADIWAFILPSQEAGAPAVTGGGEIVAAFSNDADTIKVQEYLSSAEWANSRVAEGGVISANGGLDPANASSPILQEAIRILQDPNTTFRFDASDLMPGVVGSGSFWTGMVDWVNGSSTADVTSAIDATWPAS